MCADLALPPQTHTTTGAERHVGVEIELGNLSLDHLTDLVSQHLTALGYPVHTEHQGRYEHDIHGDEAGSWRVEFDFRYLKALGREEHQEEWQKSAEKGLAWIAEAVVPVEIVTPPLPLSRLSDVESLIVQLRAAGARGSSDSLAYAFGLQLNPEVMAQDAPTILRYIQAFLCGYEWLLQRVAPDISRRISSYIAPFPKKYMDKVLHPDYAPDLETLMDDYLTDNPTRNRALDMLPLFRHLDPQRVVAAIPDDLIKARPTFHYRLPSCEIHQPDWGLFSVWNDWVAIERLAESGSTLIHCIEGYQQQQKRLPDLSHEWQNWMVQNMMPQFVEL